MTSKKIMGYWVCFDRQEYITYFQVYHMMENDGRIMFMNNGLVEKFDPSCDKLMEGSITDTGISEIFFTDSEYQGEELQEMADLFKEIKSHTQK